MAKPTGSHLPARDGEDPNLVVPRDAPAGLPEKDVEAVRLWLSLRGTRSVRTLEAYSFQARRLLDWLAARNLTLDDLDHAGVETFLRGLGDHSGGRMSTKSVDYARVVLGGMFSFLRDLGHVRRNPFAAAPMLSKPGEPPQKVLDLEVWRWFRDWLIARSEASGTDRAQRVRDRWVLSFLHGTGLRREEAVSVTMADFFRREGGLFLRVRGKGRTLRHVAIHSGLEMELRFYREAMGLPANLGTPDEEARRPVIMSLHPKRFGRPLTPRALGLIVSEAGRLAAAECPNPDGARALRSLSPHWLRHTNATHRLLAGASLETTQDELGHANPHTTRIYAKTIGEARRRDAERLARLTDGGDG